MQRKTLKIWLDKMERSIAMTNKALLREIHRDNKAINRNLQLTLIAGLDADELELMDEDERRETLEDAGLDPDDYNDF